MSGVGFEKTLNIQNERTEKSNMGGVSTFSKNLKDGQTQLGMKIPPKIVTCLYGISTT